MPELATPYAGPTLRNAVSDLYAPQTRDLLRQADIAQSNQAVRGWNSADLNEDASKLMWKANRAEEGGDLESAAVFEQQGRDLMRQGQQWAPTVQNFTDVNSVESLGDWAGGAMGNLRSSIRPALGGLAGAAVGLAAAPFTAGVINPMTGARIGATLAGYDTMTESNVAEMMMDEKIRANRSAAEIGNTARLAGGVQGALEGIVPAGVAGSVVGLSGRKAAAEIAKNGLLKTAGKRIGIDAAEEFATEFAQNPVGDVAQNYLRDENLDNIDWQGAFNAGAAGAVAGGGMGAMSAGFDAAHAGLGKVVDKTVDTGAKVKADPVGAILDAGVDLAAKAGTLKAKADNWFDERELKGKGFTQDEIDQGRLAEIQAALAGKSDLKSTSPFTEEENAMDAPSFNAHHENKLKADAATILKAGRDSTQEEKSLAADFGSGKIDAVEFQTKLHQAQVNKQGEKETNELLNGLGQGSKKSMMRPTLTDDFGEQEGRAMTGDTVTDNFGDQVGSQGLIRRDLDSKRFPKPEFTPGPKAVESSDPNVAAGRAALSDGDLQRSDRMYLESELLKPDQSKQKINTLAEILHKQGVDEKLIESVQHAGSRHQLQQLTGLMTWIRDGMSDDYEAITAIAKRYGGNAQGLFKKAYKIATHDGLVEKDDAKAALIGKRLAHAADVKQQIQSALSDSLSYTAKSKIPKGQEQETIAALSEKMVELTRAGMSEGVRKGLVEHFFGTEGNLFQVVDTIVNTGMHKQQVSKATGGGKEQVEIDADGNLVVDDRDESDDERSVLFEGASEVNAKGPQLVGFTNPKKGEPTAFDLGFNAESRDKFHARKAALEVEPGTHVKEVGLWSHYKRLAENPEQVEAAKEHLLTKYGPKLKEIGADIDGLIKNFSEGGIDIGDLSTPQRDALLGLINKQFRYLEVQRADSGDSSHDITDIASFEYTKFENKKPVNPKTFTVQDGVIFLERKSKYRGGEVSEFPVNTTQLFTQGTKTDNAGTDGTTLKGTRQGALWTSDLVMSGLTDLLLAEGGDFTSRIGYRTTPGAALTWIDNAVRDGNVKLELLPKDLALGNSGTTVGDARARAIVELRAERSDETDAVEEYESYKLPAAFSLEAKKKALNELHAKLDKDITEKLYGFTDEVTKKHVLGVIEKFKKKYKSWFASKPEKATAALQKQVNNAVYRIAEKAGILLRDPRQVITHALEAGAPATNKLYTELRNKMEGKVDVNAASEGHGLGVASPNGHEAPVGPQIKKRDHQPRGGGKDFPYGGGGTPSHNELDVQIEMRRKDQAQDSSDTAAQDSDEAQIGRLSREDGTPGKKIQRDALNGVRTGIGEDGEFAGVEGRSTSGIRVSEAPVAGSKPYGSLTPEQKAENAALKRAGKDPKHFPKERGTPTSDGGKADPKRPVKRKGGDQLDARDWVVGLLQKGTPTFNAAMKKFETDADTKARVAAGLNTLVSMSPQGLAETVLGDISKVDEAAKILARAKEVRGDEFVIRNASGKTEVRRHGDAVARRGAAEGGAERDQSGPSAAADVGAGTENLVDIAKPPAFAVQKEHAKLDGADFVFAPTGVEGFAGRLAQAAKAVGKLIDPNGGENIRDKVVYVSVPGASRNFAGITQFLADVRKLLDRGAIIRTDTKERAGTPHNAAGEGKLRTVLALANLNLTEGQHFDSWQKNLPRVKNSAQKPEANPKNKEEFEASVAQAAAHILFTLGNNVKVDFERMTDSSGSWTEGQVMNTIKLALNGDVMGAAFHESFHEFVSILKKNGGDKAIAVMERAAMSPIMQRKLERLLDGHPEAIKQLATPEEAAAFMYQFWLARLIKIGPETTTLFQKIKKLLKKVAGVFSETFRKEVEAMSREDIASGAAEQLMREFSNGKLADSTTRAAVVSALNKDAEVHEAAVERVGKTFQSMINAAGKLVISAEAMMDATGNKHMVELARGFHQKVGTAMKQVGKSRGAYSDGLRQQTSVWVGKVENILSKYEAADIELARQAMSTEKPATDRVAKQIVAEVNAFYAEMADYMKTKGVKRLNMERIDPDTGTMGVWEDIPLRQNYLPQVWSVDALMADMPAFKAELLKRHMDELTHIAEQANAELKALEGIRPGTAADTEEKRARAEFEASGKIMAKSTVQTITPEMVADAIATRLLDSQGHIEINESTSGLGITPAASAVNKRELNWLDKELFDKYKEKDMTRMMTTYAHSVVKRGEFQSRFGNDGSVLSDGAAKAVLFELGGDKLVDAAVDALPEAVKAWKKAKSAALAAKQEFNEPFPKLRAVGQEIHAGQVGQEKHDKALLDALGKLKNAFNAIQAMEGTLGRDIDPRARAASSWIVTYQSFRTLSTMLFTSFQDIVGVVANGGEAQDAWKALVAGIREVKNTFTDSKDLNAEMERAEFWGTVDAGAFLESTAQAHGSPFMSGRAKTMSDAFFKYTGAVGWNRGVRAVATSTAERIITQWKQNGIDPKDKALAARVADLFGEGFDVKNIKLDAEGRLDINDPANQAAVTRWVLTAVPAPTAAHRPIWGSDPHFQVFMQLKNYTYSFHRIMLKGAVSQARLGNYRPAMAMAVGYAPIAIAAGAIKEMLIPGEEPPWMQGGLDDYLSYGYARAGILGVPQMVMGSLVDLSELPGGNLGKAGSAFDPAGLAGPTVDQLQNILSIPFGEFMAMRDHTMIGEGLGALPGGNLVKRLERLGS